MLNEFMVLVKQSYWWHGRFLQLLQNDFDKVHVYHTLYYSYCWQITCQHTLYCSYCWVNIFFLFLHSVIRIIYFSGQEAYQQFLEALRHCGSDFIVNQLESTDASLPKAGVYSWSALSCSELSDSDLLTFTEHSGWEITHTFMYMFITHSYYENIAI